MQKSENLMSEILLLTVSQPASQPDRLTDGAGSVGPYGQQGGSYITPFPLGLNSFDLSAGSDSSK